MAFNLNGIVVDRTFDALVEKVDGSALLARLVQISEGNIEVSAESEDKTDARGNLIKKIWKTKNATVSLTNALLDLDIVAISSGSDKIQASSTNTIVMPMVTFYKATTEEITLAATPKDGTNVLVYAVEGNGSLGEKFTQDTAASETAFAISDDKLMLPTAAGVTNYLVKYEYEATENAVKVEQRTDKFPSTVKLTLTVLGYDPCTPDVLRKFYIVFPSFQPSPESTISLTTDSTLDFSGDAQVSYCDDDKLLYYIVAAEDDIEDAE